VSGQTKTPAPAPVSSSKNLRHTLAISASLGLLAGFAEGILGLTLFHYHAPAILCATLPADLALFLLLGFVLWLIARLLRRRLPPALTLFVLGLVLLYYLPTMETGSISFKILILIAASIVSFLVAAALHARRQPSLATAGRSFRWLGSLALICVIAVPLAGSWAEHRALSSLPAISPGAPNVVLVIIDTLRADHLSVYGYHRPTSPQIDRLASQGTLFDLAISPSSWTLASHASMMTGTYAHVHHTDTVKRELPPRLPTLGSVLEQEGYRTAAFSANTFFFSRRHGFGKGFIHFGDFFQSPAEALAQVHYIAAADRFLIRRHWRENFLGRQTAADINRAALHWIDAGHHPFFLALNYLDVHDPYKATQPWRHRFSKRLDPGGRVDISENMIPHLTPAQMQDEINAYDGGIAYADDQLGKLIDALARRGLLANTLLVVTSDHGEAFGEHGLVAHANALYFPLIHVPLLFRWPGHLPAGVRVARPVSTKNIGATILALLHSPARDFPGQSLAALWAGRTDPATWPLPISELARMKFFARFPNYYGPLSSVVTSDMQYIIDPREGVLLYDWKTDPMEAHNLYPDARYRAVAAALAAALEKSGARPSPKLSQRQSFVPTAPEPPLPQAKSALTRRQPPATRH
jgi:arylsulfatase A-like enzyme